MSLLTRLAGAFAPRRGGNARLLILTYHRVLREPDPLLPDEVDAPTFRAQMQVLKDNFNVLTLGEALPRLAARTLPGRAVAITFDDGYANNHDVALPILRELGLAATFFVTVGYLGHGRMFNDTVIETVRAASGDTLSAQALGVPDLPIRTAAERRDAIDKLLQAVKYLPRAEREERVAAFGRQAGASLPGALMMDVHQLRALAAAGMEIGAHTVSHPILASLDDSEALAEIADGRTLLEQMVQCEVRAFAYPNGRPGKDFTATHVEQVRSAGYDVAVTTAWACATNEHDALQLPRVAPWDKTPMRFFARLLRAYGQTHAARA